MGYYVVSKGDLGPFRVKIRSASASTTSRSCRGCCAASTCPTSSRSWPASTSSSGTSTGDCLLAGRSIPYWGQSLLARPRWAAGRAAPGRHARLPLPVQDDELHAEPPRPDGGRARTARCSCSPRSASGCRRKTSSPTGPTAASSRRRRSSCCVAPSCSTSSCPFGPDAVFADFDAGIFFALAVSSVSVLGILMAGWASANKYSLHRRPARRRPADRLRAADGARRLGVVIQAGTLNMQGIVARPGATATIFGWGGLGNPYILTQFVGFVIFMIAVQAELTQTPFDMPIAESELVAGYMTEYSGFRFLHLLHRRVRHRRRLRRHRRHAVPRRLGAAVRLSVDAIDDVANWMNVVGPLVLFTKMLVLAFLIFWVRFTYPRFREDQLQRFAWKVLIPISLVNIMVTASEGGVLMAEAQVPGLVKGLGVTLRRDGPDGQARRASAAVPHRAVPAREGGPADPRPRRHRPARGQLHGLHAVRPLRAPTGASTSRATRSWPRRAAPAASRAQVNTLDRFDIDYALCMYCGICVEVCPFDALFWSPEYEYSEPKHRRPAARQGQARRVDGDRARGPRARSRRGQEGRSDARRRAVTSPRTSPSASSPRS